MNKRYVGIFVMAVVCLVVSNPVIAADGDTDTFGYTLGSFTPTGLIVPENKVVIPSTSFTNTDDSGVSISLPFEFTLYGTTVASGGSIQVSTNGFITFSASQQSPGNFVPTSVPSASAPNATIYPFWYDLIYGTPASGAELSTGTVENGSNTLFVITYSNFFYFDDSPDNASFQLILEENTNNIYVIINNFSLLDSTFATKAIIAIENETGTDALTSAEFSNGTTSTSLSGHTFQFPGSTTPALQSGLGVGCSGGASGGTTGTAGSNRSGDQVDGGAGGGCLINLLK